MKYDQISEAYVSMYEASDASFDESKFAKHSTADLGSMASDWYKEVHNVRPHHIKNLGVDRKVTLNLLKDLHSKQNLDEEIKG